MVISVSAAVGPSVASAILALGPWPWLFAVNIPIGLAALALASRALPDNPRSGRPFDWFSALLNAGTFGLIIFGVDVISRTRSKIGGALELAAGLLFGFILVRREWPMRRPLVPFDLLRDRIFALSVATSIASFAAQLLAFVSLPFRFENTLHYNQVQTGLLMTPWPVAVGVLAPISGWLSDRVSTAVLCAIGLVLLAAGLLALALLPPHPAILDIGWRMALCGAGFGIFQAPNNRMMLAAAPRERAGAAGGMLGHRAADWPDLGSGAHRGLSAHVRQPRRDRRPLCRGPAFCSAGRRARQRRCAPDGARSRIRPCPVRRRSAGPGRQAPYRPPRSAR